MPATERRTRRKGPPLRATRSSGRRGATLPLALAAGALLLLALAAYSLGTPSPAKGRGLLPAAPQASPSATGSPTVTVTPTTTPGSITLVSPSYGSGPAGAHVTVSGSGFSGASIALTAASHPDCSSPQATLDHVALSGGGFSNHTFIWPSNLPNGTYYLCGDGTTSGPTYQQLSTNAPAISLSAPSVAQGGQLVISGANFVGLQNGSSIQLSAQQGDAKANLQPGVVDANGQFTDFFTVDLTLTGNVLIVAQSAPEGSAPAVLQATASVTITPPATATPSATVSVTPTTAGTGAGTHTTGNSGSGGGGGLLVLVIVLLIVALLVGGGAIAFVVLRRGGGGGPGSPQSPYPPRVGGYPGYSPYGVSSPEDWDATTGRMSSAGMPGQYGGLGQPGQGTYAPPGGYAGSGVGAVSQWDEPTEELGDEPGANWQPRPMTGYGDYRPSETRPGGNEYAPADPWSNAGGGYGGYGNAGGGQGGYGSYGSYGGTEERGSWRDQAGGPGAPGAQQGRGSAGQYPRRPGQGYGRDQGYGQGQGQGQGAGWPDDAPGGGGRVPPDDWRQ